MTHINQRRDTKATWASANPVLQDGEVGWEKDTRKSKLGDGVTHWNDLAYTVSDVQGTKADVGLGLVDNTADKDKPISTATKTALDALTNGKAPLASPQFTGDPKAPTPATADNDTSIATTAFVKAQGYSVRTGTESLTNKDLTDATNSFPALGLIGMTVFTGSGSFSKASMPRLKAVRVRLCGGGGSGGGAAATAAGQCATGGGGGAGGYSERWIAASALGTTETVTVGGGGASGGAGASGQAGSTSSFGALLSATGGAAGGVGSAHTPPGSSGGGAGAGGAGSTGSINLVGGGGNDGFSLNATRASTAAGGTCPLSGGSQRVAITATGANGSAGLNYGAGGSGGCNAQSQPATAGGAGAPGVVIVEMYG